MSRQFTKYPSNYVKASSYANPYMKDLVEYLDYLSDDEIADIQVEHIDDGYEPEGWIEIPEHLRSTVENAIGSDLCSPNESYWYQIEYHPDDDSIIFGINTDLNLETLRGVSKQTEDRFKQKFRESLGIEASTSIKADTDPEVQAALGREVDRLRRSDLFKGKVPKRIQDATLSYMSEYHMGLYDAFKDACCDFAPKGSELYNAWYYDDFRKFIPSAYLEEYLDFDKYPLKY